ncbi:MAG TPA: SPFH domain-containing protein, partial [Gemmataceae bacterium]|nr:SPFH domain-containing protein [Gemmataceae bacterium]
LPLVVRLSRETVRVIRQNIIWFAFGVNGVGIVLTAWLWPLLTPASWYEQSPLAAVLYHQVGSLAVLLNAMRLLWFDRPATNAAWVKTRAATRRIDSWLQRYADADEWLHWLSHRWRTALAVVVALLVAGYALSGLTQVRPDERAVVRRFGRALDADLGPGLHWRWPWPVEHVTKLRPDSVHSVDIGFRATGDATSAALTWSSPHGDSLERRDDEAVMLTGDGNLVELQATVRYTIQDPHVYLFEVRDPDEVLRAAAESVLRETVAGRPFLDLLTTSRRQFQDDVLARLRRRLEGYGPAGLGIRLDGLSLEDLHPPQQVVPAYYEVTRAMEARDRIVNDARAEAVHTKQKAEADAQKTVRSAEAARKEVVSQAEAERDVFLARQRLRGQLSLRQECWLLWEAGQELQRGARPADVARAYLQRRKQWVAVQATLNDFRQFWGAVGQALTGRDKLIIDADKVPGRRQLLLFDPELFRIPVPVLGMPARGAANRPPPGPFLDEGP